MLWVLKRTVSMRWFFCVPKTYILKLMAIKYLQFYTQKFGLSKPMQICSPIAILDKGLGCNTQYQAPKLTYHLSELL